MFDAAWCANIDFKVNLTNWIPFYLAGNLLGHPATKLFCGWCYSICELRIRKRYGLRESGSVPDLFFWEVCECSVFLFESKRIFKFNRNPYPQWKNIRDIPNTQLPTPIGSCFALAPQLIIRLKSTLPNPLFLAVYIPPPRATLPAITYTISSTSPC